MTMYVGFFAVHASLICFMLTGISVLSCDMVGACQGLDHKTENYVLVRLQYARGCVKNRSLVPDVESVVADLLGTNLNGDRLFHRDYC